MNINLYENDLPAHLKFGSMIAVDSEFMGLQPYRDRLCLVQIGDGEGNCQLDAAGFYEKSRAEREAKYDQLRDCSV